ncbi:MAG: hypothetical protein B6I24_01735 [Bacteroidetes bacterium 4572_128]|nr:MAG: hypothetical protein B6I24_01735 [Bacteroidetes bacterium 4572_128]
MKNKAIFLDRDGVINNDVGHYYIYKKDDFKLNENVILNLKKFQKNGFLLIIISNQGGISKGIYEKKDVEKVHNFLKKIFEKNGIFLKEIYYCPHHNDFENCICRKPDSLLLEKAISRFNIDVSKSYFVGDSERDIIAGKKVGMKTIKIEKNKFKISII